MTLSDKPWVTQEDIHPSDQSEEIINLSAGVIGVGEGMGDQRGQVNVQRHDQFYDQRDFHHYTYIGHDVDRGCS